MLYLMSLNEQKKSQHLQSSKKMNTAEGEDRRFATFEQEKGRMEFFQEIKALPGTVRQLFPLHLINHLYHAYQLSPPPMIPAHLHV